jgi:hypothetical protein
MKQLKELVANVPMLQEWTDNDFKKIKQALKNFFLFKSLQTKDGVKIVYTYNDLENLLGLPYTSSSNYAGVWITNTELYSNDFPGFKYEGFAITNGGKCVGILWDKDENEKIIEL